MNKFDVAIVGGSVAGSVAGYILGQRGIRTAIVDGRDFTRRKPCGEGLSGIGKSLLDDLGLWRSEIKFYARPFYGYTLQRPGGKIMSLRVNPASEPEGFGIRRELLDQYLWSTATAQAAVSSFPANVNNIQQTGSGWELTVNDGRKFSAKHLIAACSLGALKLLDDETQVRRKPNRYAMALWYQGTWQEGTPDTVQIFSGKDFQIIITPTSNNLVNLSILVSKGSEPRAKELIGKGEEFLRNVGFEIDCCSELLGAPAVNWERRLPRMRRAYLIGDSIERFDPVGGMGLTHAIYSASIAAGAITAQIDGKLSEKEALGRYFTTRERGARYLRFFTDVSRELIINQGALAGSFVAAFPRVSIAALSSVKGLCLNSFTRNARDIESSTNWSNFSSFNYRLRGRIVS